MFIIEHLPYSREQKHVSISDTPMLLIEINSISNMGCQKKTFLFVVRMSWKKVLFLKKNRHVTIRDCKKSDFLNTC